MIETIEAKSLLQKVKFDGSNWFGITYNMNLYKGCCHGCIYCDSRSNCYRIDNFDKVRVKANTTRILERELMSKRQKGVIGMGAMSDSYNPFEKKLEVTRDALKLIARYGYGVSIETKSPLITRDIDLFKEIAKHNTVILKLTITAADDVLSKKIEQRVQVSSERFRAIKELSEAGIFCGVLLTPVLPFITDTEENIRTIVRLAYENGAKFVYGGYGVSLRENQRDYFLKHVEQVFPGMANRYRKIYGNTYWCNSPKMGSLKHVLESECKKYGLFYKMEDIIKNGKGKDTCEQLRLF
ncbi:MAG: SPL family radical SAM protein [Bacillaceae bacterium]